MQTLSIGLSSQSVSIPQTDLNVSPICLGTGGIGSEIDPEESLAILDTFIEYGGTFIDTAHNYGDWIKGGPRSASERTIGKWLQEKGLRRQITLATKGGHFYTPDKPRLSRTELESDLNGSLEVLKTDYIDLYWLHRDDPATPVANIIETLNSFSQSGKVRYFGASNWKTSRLIEAQAYAASTGLQGFVANQPLWNAAVLAGPPYGDPTTSWMDEELFNFHRKSGMAVIPYQSQAYGLFQRMYDGTLDSMNSGFRGFYKPLESSSRFQRMKKVMDQTGLSITQVTLAYLTSQPITTVPIVGCRRAEQVVDSMSAAGATLTYEQVEYIEHGR